MRKQKQQKGVYQVGQKDAKVVKPKKPKKSLKFSLKDYRGWHFRPIFAFWGGFSKRVRFSLIFGLILLLGLSWGIFNNFVRFPPIESRDVSASGLGAIQVWTETFPAMDGTITDLIGSESYLAMEVKYANSREEVLNFQKAVLGTVKYLPEQVSVKNIYGNDALSRNYKKVYVDSLVNEKDEEVTVEYIDYSKIRLDKEKISKIMSEYKVSKDDMIDMETKLIPVFCKYMVDYGEYPVTTEKHIPEMEQTGSGYTMTGDEDVYLDVLLFSSDSFYKLLRDFSVVATGGSENPEWSSWIESSEKEQKLMDQPDRIVTDMQPTEEWVAWSNLSDEDKEKTKEPYKYNWKKYISDSWCGAYYLYNGLNKNGDKVEKVFAGLGDGTIENPAGIGTPVTTSAYVTIFDEQGVAQRILIPVKVKLLEYGVSQDAIDYFESKDARNRGYDLKSELQHIYFIYEVTNLSDKEVTIGDNMSLCDDSQSLAVRTGLVYGLNNMVKLKPDETGVIESWASSLTLNKKYLIWGADFDRSVPAVWFRVLAGDIDDPSEEKGVTLNNSRYEDLENKTEIDSQDTTKSTTDN